MVRTVAEQVAFRDSTVWRESPKTVSQIRRTWYAVALLSISVDALTARGKGNGQGPTTLHGKHDLERSHELDHVHC